MNYVLLVVMHVCAVLIWMISMLGTSIAMAALADGGPMGTGSAIVSWLRRCDRFVTMPAMALTWMLGVTLVIEGGWLGATWLTIELVFVIALSALHGIQAKTLRKMAAHTETRLPLLIRLFPVIIVLCALTVIWLVLTKPFY